MVLFWKAQLDSRIGSVARGGPDARGDRQGTADQGARSRAHADGRRRSRRWPIWRSRAATSIRPSIASRTSRTAVPARSAGPTAGSSLPPTSPRASGTPRSRRCRPLDRPQEPADERRARLGRRHLLPPSRPCGGAGGSSIYVLKVNPAHPGAVITQASCWPTPRSSMRRPHCSARPSPTAETSHTPSSSCCSRPSRTGCPRPTPRAPAQAAVDQGLAVQPHALELVQARYQLVRQPGDAKAAAAFVAAKAKDAGSDDLSAACSSRSRSNRKTTPLPSGCCASCSRRPQGFDAGGNVGPAGPGSGDRGGRATTTSSSRASKDKAAALIREFRAQFPG